MEPRDITTEDLES